MKASTLAMGSHDLRLVSEGRLYDAELKCVHCGQQRRSPTDFHEFDCVFVDGRERADV